jgi:hypothetical protein
MRASTTYMLGLFLDPRGWPCYRRGYSGLSGGTASGSSGIVSGFIPLIMYRSSSLTS